MSPADLSGALRRGVRWEFESFPDYLDFIERIGHVPNVAAFIGHDIH